MRRPWLWLRAAFLCPVIGLASCGNLNSHSACYVFVWNAVVACWPEDERTLQPKTQPPAVLRSR